MQDFRNLKVWEKAHTLTLAVYPATEGFPKREWFGLASQMRRACVSIGSNIAEGCGRGSDADFARFLLMAMGSASELDYQLLLASDLGFLIAETYPTLEQGITEIKRMLSALIAKLNG